MAKKKKPYEKNQDLFPDAWLDNEAINVDKLAEQVVANDKWDREDLSRMVSAVPELAVQRDNLQGFVDQLGGVSGKEAMNDTFWHLLKAVPEILPAEEVKPTHIINRAVMDEARKLDDIERLRAYSVNDDVQAALSAVQVEDDLETIFDRLKSEIDEASALQKALQDLAQARKQLAESEEEKRDIDQLLEDWLGENAPPQSGDKSEDEGEGESEGEGEAGENGEGSAGGNKVASDQDAGEGEGEGEEGGQGQGTTPGDGEGDPQESEDGESSGQGNVPSDKEGEDESEQDGEGQGNGAPADMQARQDAANKAVEEAQKAVDQAYEEAKARGETFERSMRKKQPMIRGALRNTLKKATKEASAMNDTAVAWGMEPGQLQRMDPKERMELAKRLNNEKFRRVAELFGPMRNLMLAEQDRKTTHSHEEVYDIEIGNDLGRIVPQELLHLVDEDIEWEFYRKYYEHDLLQYAMQGQERLAKGSIVFCEDGSGSMSGDREMWAKAVMLCLLHLAKLQKREMSVIHFSSAGQFHLMTFKDPEDWNIEHILEAAEVFFGGGTDYVTPMKESLRILNEEFDRTGKVKADVVFVTDDECMVPTELMDEYLEDMHRMQSTTWGISVSGGMRRKGALDDMTEGKVAQIEDFFSGSDIRNIFAGV